MISLLTDEEIKETIIFDMNRSNVSRATASLFLPFLEKVYELNLLKKLKEVKFYFNIFDIEFYKKDHIRTEVMFQSDGFYFRYFNFKTLDYTYSTKKGIDYINSKDFTRNLKQI